MLDDDPLVVAEGAVEALEERMGMYCLRSSLISYCTTEEERRAGRTLLVALLSPFVCECLLLSCSAAEAVVVVDR